MNARIGLALTLALSILCGGISPVRAPAAEAGAVLDEIRAALAARDLPTAKAKLAEAEKVRGDDAFADQRDRLQLLYQYVEDFWKAVDQGGKTLQAVDELMIGDVRTAVVEYQTGWLVLRVKGENKRYSFQTMPAKVALTLAQRVLKPDAPQNKVYFGAFLLVDGRGDRDLAVKYLTEAQKGGADVAALLPEAKAAKVEPLATLPVEVPPVTPIMRKLLAPDNWYLRRQDGGKVTRDPLKDEAQQTAEGNLQLNLPENAAAGQLVYSRKLAGNFGCRIVLKNVEEGQVFGLFSADSLEVAHQVPLPKGSVMIEFMRQVGKFQCRINQEEVAVETRGDAPPTMGGLIGVTLPPGSRPTITWFELQSR